jgi:subtilisin family serine protease
MFEAWSHSQRLFRITCPWIGFLVFPIIILFSSNASFAQRNPAKWAEGELLVGLRSGVAKEQAAKLFTSHGATVLEQFPQLNVHRIKVSSSALDAVERALSRRPEVEFVERNGMLELNATPNDPLYPSEWHLGKIGAPAAWDLARGTSSIIVAVVDTGVDANHPDLVNKVVPGYNAYNDNNDSSDVYGHGTMVAGIIGAESNNGLGVSSVGWMNPVMPIRITDSSLAVYYSVVANGITWAADHGAKVINTSIAGVAGSATVTSAASYARNKGALVIAAAGNCGCFDSTSENTSIISVSATDGSDNLASWSSQGNYVDVAAPGVAIYTTTSGGGYGAPSGTSVASPVVAGVVALMMSANPSLKPSQIESLLEATTDDLGPAGYDTAYGYGRLNAYRAVAAAATNSPPPDTTAPVASITSPGNGSTVSGGVSVSVSATDNTGVTRVDLYVDGSFYASDATAPYGFFMDTTAVGNGSHNLAAVAFDAVGNTGNSATINVNVNNNQTADTQPPSVSIVAPVSTGKGPGNKLAVSVSASDNVGVAQVQLYVDGTLVGTDTAPPYNFNINTAKLSAGSHSLQAKAYDPSGNVGLSSPLSFSK